MNKRRFPFLWLFLLPVGLAGVVMAWSGGFGCRKNTNPAAFKKAKRKLTRYAFDGETAKHLSAVCELARSTQGYRAAQAQWLCARTSLDWYLAAAFTGNRRWMVALARHLGAGCVEVSQPRCGVRLLDGLIARFKAVQRAEPGGHFDWPARQAVELIRLQRDESPYWSKKFLATTRELARPAQPLAVQAQVMIAGATHHMVSVLARTDWQKRLGLFLRTLGFACPVEERRRSVRLAKRDLSAECRLACKEMSQRLIQAPPELRKRLIAAHCPLSHLGFTERGQAVYLSQPGLLAARDLVYVARTLARLQRRTDHPLVRLLRTQISATRKKLTRLRLGLPYPEMSPGEQGYVKLPYCPAAREPTYAPVYLAADVHRVSVGIAPILAVESARTVILSDRVGYPFPGRLVPEPLRDELPDALKRARRTWVRLSGVANPKPLALYVHTEVAADRLNRILAVLGRLGIASVRLLLRSDRGGVGGLTVALEPQPDKGVRWGRGQPDKVLLYLDGQEMILVAGQGPLAEKPFRSRSGDLAGLREHLERSRRHYRKIDTLVLRFRGKVRYLEIARVLVSVLRNSSGRTLYPTVTFQFAHGQST
jgi:hypothetical protein